MRRALLALALSLLATPGWAAVAFDAASNGAGIADVLSWTHTPSGTPRAIIVFLAEINQSSDTVTGVTYGGTTMTECAGSPNLNAGGEPGGVYCYFLGSSIPTGPQTVAVTRTDTTNGMGGESISLTATTDTEFVDSDGTINSDTATNPSITLSLAGRTSFAAVGFFSGQNSINSITPFTDWTSRAEEDMGVFAGLDGTIGFYTYNTIGTTDVTAGWTQGSETGVGICVAVSEVTGGAPNAPKGLLLGVW